MPSNVTEIAFADYPQAPSVPLKNDTLSSLTSIYLYWQDVPFTQISVRGYELWMDSGSDGFFHKVFDALDKPGVMNYLATGLETGRAYIFKLRAVNFNGAGPFSSEVTYYSCLPPEMIIPPQYVKSTETTLEVKWSAPAHLYGCPLQAFELYRNQVQGGDANLLVGTFQPHINNFDITAFTVADTSHEQVLRIKAITAAGSCISGTSSYVLANTPQKPDVAVNDAAVTNN
jgi:hypothetical protein